MAKTRRDFLRTSACALGGAALASSIESFGMIHALAAPDASDYKALVCVFMNGGNDGNNTFVDLNQYSSYATSRGADLAIPQANFCRCHQSAEVPSAFIRTCRKCRLFNSGKAALCNQPLVEPLPRRPTETVRQEAVAVVLAFDQVGLFQTAIANLLPKPAGAEGLRIKRLA